MHSRRLGRLSGATAERLLDGGDGPSPLPELLAAATAPATAAELRGESVARAAFRSSTRPAPLPDDVRRRHPVRVTTSIMIAKAIAAIALTAGTAGGIALATTATPADAPARTTSDSAARDAASSSPVLTTPTIGATPADPDEATDAATGDESGRSGSAGPAARTAPEAKASHPPGLCGASSNNATSDDTDKAADPRCTDADAPADAGAATVDPAGPPTVAPGKPGKQTGKPDDAGRAADGNGAENTAEDTARPGKAVGHGAAHTDKNDRGKSAEHRQDG